MRFCSLWYFYAPSLQRYQETLTEGERLSTVDVCVITLVTMLGSKLMPQESSITSAIVFIAQATMATVLNYGHNTFIVQVTGFHDNNQGTLSEGDGSVPLTSSLR